MIDAYTESYVTILFIDSYRKNKMDEKYEVVISGIGGVFPESNSVDELHKNLLNKVNMISVNDTLWTPGKHIYKVNHIS